MATIGTLGFFGEIDWLAVSLTANQAYEFTITGLTGSPETEVGAPADLASDVVFGGPNGFGYSATPATDTVWFTPESTGTYYVALSDASVSLGSTYSVSAIAEPNDHTDNTTTSGIVTVGGAVTTGIIGVPDEIDWLAVSLTANKAYEFTINGLTNFAQIGVGTAAGLASTDFELEGGLGGGAPSSLLDDYLYVGSIATLATDTAWFTPESTGTYYVGLLDPNVSLGSTYSVSAVAEPNDHTDNTTTSGIVTVGGAATTGTLGVPGEVDWLAVSLTANQAYEFTINGLTNLANISFGAAGDLGLGGGAAASGQSNDIGSSGAMPELQAAWFTPESTGTYYVALSDEYASLGSTYSVSAVAEPNDNTDNPTTSGIVTVGGAATTGTLGLLGEVDWLAVSLTANQAYEFTFTNPPEDAVIEVGAAEDLRLGDGAPVYALNSLNIVVGGLPPADTAWFTPESTGTYYVAISDPFADPGLTYSVSAFTEPNDHTDNTTTSGIVTVGGAATNGTLGVPGEVDWLAVSLSANQAYEFTISGLTDFAQIELGAAVDLQYGGGALVNALNPYLGVSAATLATDNIWFTPEQTGTYYVELFDEYASVGSTYNVSAATVPNDYTDDTTTDGVVLVGSPACFAAGTRILTAGGRSVAVEALREGDAMQRLDGSAAEIVWIGYRTVNIAKHPRPGAVRPVVIEAGALGDGAPKRDLVVSPDHALYLDGHLIPAKALINGFSIRQLNRRKVTYYHIELAEHAVLFAEGAGAESYLETGNRGAFENGGAAVALRPDFAQALRKRKGCAPFAEAGPVVEAVRQRLLDRAAIPTTHEPDVQVTHVSGGAVVRSRNFVPGELCADPRDRRRLGVKVAGLLLDGVTLSLDHPGLAAGWHDMEADGRWTDGAGFIPSALVNGARDIRVLIAASGIYALNGHKKPTPIKASA